MLAVRIIKLAISPRSFPVVIVKQKEGSLNFCEAYQQLNKRMKAENFPLPKIEEVIDDMTGSTTLSKLDMFSGY